MQIEMKTKTQSFPHHADQDFARNTARCWWEQRKSALSHGIISSVRMRIRTTFPESNLGHTGRHSLILLLEISNKDISGIQGRLKNNVVHHSAIYENKAVNNFNVRLQANGLGLGHS